MNIQPLCTIFIILSTVLVSVFGDETFILDYDDSCKTPEEGYPDVRPIFDQAFLIASEITDSAYTQLQNANNANDFASLTCEEIWKIYRIYTLLSAWFVSPWMTSDPFVARTADELIINLQRPRDNPNFVQAIDPLLVVLDAMRTIRAASVPKMYCGPKFNPVSDDITMAVHGTFQLFHYEHDSNAPDDPDWFYVDNMGDEPFELRPGEKPCGDEDDIVFFPQDSTAIPYIIWCPYIYQHTLYTDIFPTLLGAETTDYSSFEEPDNELGHYVQSTVGYMLIIFHHFRVEDSGVYNNAEGYNGIITLANQIIQMNGRFDVLSKNVDSVIWFIVATSLERNEWSTYYARPLPS